MNNINKFSKFLSHNPLLLLLLFSIVTAVSFGIDLTRHQIYNLSELFIIKAEIANIMDWTKSGFFGYTQDPFNPLYYYYRYLAPALEYGAIYIGLSIFIRFIAFLLIYRLSSFFLARKTALLMTATFLFAYLIASHGSALNGLWGSVGIFPALLSALATLFGIISFLQRRYLLAGIAVGLSIMLHSLYGVTAFAFLFIGFILILYKKNLPNIWSALSVMMLPIFCVIFYTAYQAMTSSNNIEFSQSFTDWYRYVASVDYEDVLLIVTFRNYGYGLVPLFLTGLYLAYQEKDKSELQLLTIGSVLSLILFTLIEILHQGGIFFGDLSELFIASQLRRGVWIAALFSLIQISKYVYDRKEEIFKRRSWILLLIFSISIYLIPSVLGIVILTLALSMVLKSRISIFLLLITLSMAVIHYYAEDYDLLWQLKLFRNNLLFTAVAAVTMLILKNLKQDQYVSFTSTILVVIVVLFTGQGILKNKLINDISITMSDGLLSKTNASRMHDHLKAFPYDPIANTCMVEISPPTSGEKIQLPIRGPRNNWTPLFSYEEVYGYHITIYSRKSYELALRRLRTLFGKDTVDSFFNTSKFYNKTAGAKEEVKEYFLDAFNNLSEPHLDNLRDNENLRFYLLKSERTDISHALVCKGNQYYVYDLNLL